MSTETLDSLSRIRQVRHEISAEFGHDPQRLFQHFLQVQHELRNRISPQEEGEDAPRFDLKG